MKKISKKYANKYQHYIKKKKSIKFMKIKPNRNPYSPLMLIWAQESSRRLSFMKDKQQNKYHPASWINLPSVKKQD